MGWKNKVLVGDVREVLRQIPKRSIQCAVTSPPYYGLRDYGVDGQIGSEPTPGDFVRTMVEVFRLVRRVLRDDGTLWVNLGDTYAANRTYQVKDSKNRNVGNHRGMKVPAGLKAKDLMLMPHRVAIALQDDGWYVRNDVIWAKPNGMTQSVYDRCVSAHEHLFLLTKNPHYYFDYYAIRQPVAESSKSRYKYSFGGAKNEKMREDGYRRVASGNWGDAPDERICRDVWWIPVRGTKEAHFATFPQALVRRCVLAGTSAKGACPECGAPWVRKLERKREATRPGTDSKVNGRGPKEVGNRDVERHVTTVKMLGWEASCTCGRKDTVPCVVGDIFLGSGTSAIVAKKLGRDWVGAELNPKYAAMAERRIGRADAGLGLF